MKPEFKVHPHVIDLIGRLHAADHEGYIVGGGVRDLLLNLEPKDYDIATSATPSQIKRIFRRQARVIGRRFRLVHVRYSSIVYEVSTFRREPTPEERVAREDDDGVVIWRDNQYGSREEDARRRDFTVNAIFYNPLGKGELIDCVGGLSDLEEGMVRTIGEPAVRLAEDPVRILRALKLVAEYDFSMEEDLRQEVSRQGEKISQASSSRLFEELLKIFAKPYSVKTLAVCRQFDFLVHFLPGLDRIWDEKSGLLLRRLAAARDRRKYQGGYWKSRRLALATIAFPAVLEELGIDDPADFNEVPFEEDKTIKRAIKDLFAPLPLPNALIANVKDLILLFPRFFDQEEKNINQVVRNPQYRWARELFSLCSEVLEWAPEVSEPWPPSDAGPPPRGRRGRDRRRSRRGGRRPRQKPDSEE